MVEAIEGLFEQHGNRSLLDATLKKTTQVYIKTQKDQHAMAAKTRTTWDAIRPETKKGYSMTEQEPEPQLNVQIFIRETKLANRAH